MAFTITATHETEAGLAEILKSRGIEADTSQINSRLPSEQPPAGSVPPVKPGETPVDKSASESAPASEAGDESAQETQVTAKTGDDKPKPRDPDEPGRGNFKTKIAKAQQTIDRLKEDLELEQGSKRSLQDRLAKAEEELTALKKPTEPEKPKDDTPIKPKRPTKSEFMADGYLDEEKFEAALVKYDDDRDAYDIAMRTKTVRDELAARDLAEATRRNQETAEKVFNEFVVRRDSAKDQIPDFQEMRDAAGDYDLPQYVELAIIQSEVPAYLMNFFDKDRVSNDGKELTRIMRMDEPAQNRAMGRLEERLIAEAAIAKSKPVEPKEPKEPKPAVVKKTVAEAPIVDEQPEKPPAKVQPKEAVEPPIEPLGGRTGTKDQNLGEARDVKEYIRLRNQGVVR